MRLLVFVVLLVVGFWAWQEHSLRSNEHRLAEVATELAGRKVGISCPGFFTRLVEITPNAGWVQFDSRGKPASKASLNTETCGRLEDFHGGEIDERTGQAIVVLAHESFHLAGVTNEAQTQCYAVQRTELAASRLGATPERARAIAEWALDASPRTLPQDYWQPEACRDGGVWDLRPDSPRWP
jgi:hypothetical protein